MERSDNITVVIPAKNEAETLAELLPRVRRRLPDAEIIVVDDGSTDSTHDVCVAEHVVIIRHDYSKGNGAAIKAGARAASNELLLLMDGDGQHDPDDIDDLIRKMEMGFDMVVGARSRSQQASIGRLAANTIYNLFGSWMVGHQIEDMTSGFRLVKRELFCDFLYLMPNGFSYPTTTTMAFFRAGYSIAYVSINVSMREGESHIRPWRDGVRFLLIIFKVGTLYSPLKIFFPLSILFGLAGSGHYLYTFIASGRFTNMSAVLLTTCVMIFLMGLISEQITMLIYKETR